MKSNELIYHIIAILILISIMMMFPSDEKKTMLFITLPVGYLIGGLLYKKVISKIIFKKKRNLK